MLFVLPDNPTLYAALLARCPDYEGLAYVGVTSTGIFCRLTCGARKPKPENCQFFETAADCIVAGFHGCRRCRPLARMEQAEPSIATLLAALEALPARRWSEADLIGMGFDPSAVRRRFRRYFGTTFLGLARRLRLQMGLGEVSAGAQGIEAQSSAGFASPSAFRIAFAQLLGVSPGCLPENAPLKADCLNTPLGQMLAVADASALHLLEFVDRRALPNELARLQLQAGCALGIGPGAVSAQLKAELAQYFNKTQPWFEVPVIQHGIAFERTVWAASCDIPMGQMRWRLCFHATELYLQTGRWRAVAQVAVA